MKKVTLYLKEGSKTYIPYTFTVERGKLFISDGVETLPFDEWLNLKHTGYIGEIPYINEYNKEKQKIKILKLLKLFSNDETIQNIIQKEFNLIRKRSEIFNKRELARERRERRCIIK